MPKKFKINYYFFNYFFFFFKFLWWKKIYLVQMQENFLLIQKKELKKILEEGRGFRLNDAFGFQKRWWWNI